MPRQSSDATCRVSTVSIQMLQCTSMSQHPNVRIVKMGNLEILSYLSLRKLLKFSPRSVRRCEKIVCDSNIDKLHSPQRPSAAGPQPNMTARIASRRSETPKASYSIAGGRERFLRGAPGLLYPR